MADTDLQTIDQSLQQAAQLPPDLMLLKMENESIMSMAATRPRDPDKIIAQLSALIDAYPAAADKAIFSKPVGSVYRLQCAECHIKYDVSRITKDTQCPSCSSAKHGAGKKVTKFAEGLSIRAAESIRTIYGYTRLSTTTEQLADGVVRISGVLVDYAAGNMTCDDRIVTPWYKGQSGRMERTPLDRFLNVVVKAEKAKLRRDLILDSTDGIIKAKFYDACENKLKELVAPEIIEQKIVPAFAEYGITASHLDKLIGRPMSLGWNEEERLALRKILSALKNEETTVRELLDGIDTAGKDVSPAASGPVRSGDLSEPKQQQEPDESPEKPTGAASGHPPDGHEKYYLDMLATCKTSSQVAGQVRIAEKDQKIDKDGMFRIEVAATERQEELSGSHDGSLFDTTGTSHPE